MNIQYQRVGAKGLERKLCDSHPLPHAHERRLAAGEGGVCVLSGGVMDVCTWLKPSPLVSLFPRYS